MRRRRCLETKQQLHHLTNLLFLGAAIADNGTLDLCRRVLHDVASGFDCSQHRDTAGVTELQRAADVRRMKQIFDGDTVGMVGRQQRRELGVNSRETIRKCIAGRRRDGATGQEHVPASIRLHAAITGALGAGIDAEDSHPSRLLGVTLSLPKGHAREASISFSSMSKFAQTC